MVGRPRKQSAALRRKIIAMVNSGLWTGEGKVSALLRLLEQEGFREPISHDTLARIVDDIWQETGDLSFRRRARRKPQIRIFTQNSLQTDHHSTGQTIQDKEIS